MFNQFLFFFRCFCVLLCALIVPRFAAAQTLFDTQNYYWRVTEEGELTRFDGYESQDLSAAAGIENAPVLLLFEDKSKRVWVSVADNETLLFFDSLHQVRYIKNNTGIRQLNIIAATQQGNRLFFQEKDGTVLSFYSKNNELRRVFDEKLKGLNFKTPISTAPIYDTQLQRPLSQKSAAFIRSTKTPTQTGIPFGKDRLTLLPDARLNRYDQNGRLTHTLYITHRHLPEMRAATRWTNLAQFGEMLYVGTSEGVVFIHKTAWNEREIRLRPADYNITNFEEQKLDGAANYVRIGAIHDFTQQKDTVWLATENGLFLFCTKKRTLQRIELQGEAYSEVTDLTNDGKRLLFVQKGQLYALASVPSRSRVFFEQKDGLNMLRYDTLREIYWVSLLTGGVVGFQKRGGIMTQKIIEESHRDKFKAFNIEDNGTLWGLTAHYIVRIALTKKGFEYRRFELHNTEVATNFCIDKIKNTIVVFGEGGIYETAISQLRPSNRRPFMRLESLKINGIDTSTVARDFVLDYNKRNVLIGYKAILADDANNFLYKYRIETTRRNFGSSKTVYSKWQFTEQRELNLALETGKHVVEIAAINYSGVTSVPLRLQFRVSPPIWTQAWFWILIILLISGIAVALLFAQRRRLQGKNEFLKMEIRMLQAQMNTHFIANALTAIQGFIMSNKKLNALNYIVDFHGLMRMFLDASRTNEHLLEKELQLIKNYISLQQLFQTFNYVLEVDEETYPHDLFIPTSLIQPFVENAIQHGLQYKQSGEKNLYLRFSRTRYELTCEIEDDGIGRAASRNINAANDRFKKFSTGVSGKIIQNRLHLLNNYDHYKIKVFYDDLFENGKPAGTKVTLKISLPKKITEQELEEF